MMGNCKENQILTFWFLTYRCAVLTWVPPVPVLSEMPLRTGLTFCRCVGSAVSSQGCARRALVTQQEVSCHRVAILVLWWYSLLLEGPGKRSCKKLREKESRLSTESTAVTKSLMKPMSCTAPLWLKVEIFLYVRGPAKPKLPVSKSWKKGHSCKVEAARPGGHAGFKGHFIEWCSGTYRKLLPRDNF